MTAGCSCDCDAMTIGACVPRRPRRDSPPRYMRGASFISVPGCACATAARNCSRDETRTVSACPLFTGDDQSRAACRVRSIQLGTVLQQQFHQIGSSHPSRDLQRRAFDLGAMIDINNDQLLFPDNQIFKCIIPKDGQKVVAICGNGDIAVVDLKTFTLERMQLIGNRRGGVGPMRNAAGRLECTIPAGRTSGS